MWFGERNRGVEPDKNDPFNPDIRNREVAFSNIDSLLPDSREQRELSLKTRPNKDILRK